MRSPSTTPFRLAVLVTPYCALAAVVMLVASNLHRNIDLFKHGSDISGIIDRPFAYTSNLTISNNDFVATSKATASIETGDKIFLGGLHGLQIDWALWEKRTSSLSPVRNKFSFLHISKTAGASWIIELGKLLPKFKPRQKSGMEHTLKYQKEKYWKGVPPEDVKMLTSLKHPRAHVWSLWGECVFDKSWKRHQKIPYNPSLAYETNFESWLDHFLHADGQSLDNNGPRNFTERFYNCLHPANYQSRSLAGPARNSAKGPDPDRSDPHRFEPDAGAVRRAREGEFAWIALSEFYGESECLLFHRILLAGDGDPGVRAMRRLLAEHVERRCRCPPSPGGGVETVHFTHFNESKRSSMLDVGLGILEKLDRLVRIDTISYREALAQFLREIAWLESDGQLGRRVLCDDALERWGPELRYLEGPGAKADGLAKAYWSYKQELLPA